MEMHGGIFRFCTHDRERVGLPLAGSFVAAGFPSPADDYVEKSLDLKRIPGAQRGSHFFRAGIGRFDDWGGIHHGDIQSSTALWKRIRGGWCIAVIDGEMLVKRLRRIRGVPILFAETPENRLSGSLTKENSASGAW
jgi:DNA polymerase V